MQATYHNTHQAKGFTLVEIIVAITIMTVLGGLVFFPLSDLFTSNTTSSAQVTQDSDTRGALRQIASDLTYSNGFIGSITTPTTPTGSDNGTATWTYAAATNSPSNNVDANTQILMAKLDATDKAYTDTNRMPVGANGNCDLTEQRFAQNTYVYFVKSGTLYRRTMINNPDTGGAPCTSIAQKQTCSNMSSAICEATDAVLLKNVISFLIEFNDPVVASATKAKITAKTQPPSVTSPVSTTEATTTVTLIQQNS